MYKFEISENGLEWETVQLFQDLLDAIHYGEEVYSHHLWRVIGGRHRYYSACLDFYFYKPILSLRSKIDWKRGL